MNREKNTSAVLTYGVLVFIIIICLFPIVWMCLISIRSTSESITGFNSPMVSSPTMADFKRLSEMIPIGQNVFNNMFTTIMGAIAPLFFCTLADFASARYRFPGRKFLFYLVITTVLMSPEVGDVPLFIIMKKMGLINSLWSLIVPRVATAVDAFYMNQYTTGVPDGLAGTARIDGCFDFGVFTRVTLPVTKPTMTSWGAITLIARWNDFFWPLLYLRKQAKCTLVVTISLLPVSEGLSIPRLIMLAGTTLVIIPVIILYLILEEFQKVGMMEGAVKR